MPDSEGWVDVQFDASSLKVTFKVCPWLERGPLIHLECDIMISVFSLV